MVRQLAYSTELLVCINQALKQYKQEEEKNSTQLNTLKLSLSLLSLCVFAHFQLHYISALHLSNYRQNYGKKSRPTITAKMVATYQPLTLAMQPCLTWLPTTICVHTQQEQDSEGNFKNEATDLFDSISTEVKKAYCNCLQLLN